MLKHNSQHQLRQQWHRRGLVPQHPSSNKGIRFGDQRFITVETLHFCAVHKAWGICWFSNETIKSLWEAASDEEKVDTVGNCHEIAWRSTQYRSHQLAVKYWINYWQLKKNDNFQRNAHECIACVGLIWSLQQLVGVIIDSSCCFRVLSCLSVYFVSLLVRLCDV